MDPRELDEISGHVNSVIRGILRNQQVLADIKDKIQRRDRDPLEEDFIDSAISGEAIGRKNVRVINGVVVEVSKLHRRGVSAADIAGADVLYEVARRKFVVIQFKKPDRQSQVHKEAAQLDALMATCSNPCPPFSAPIYCASWY